MMTCLAFVVTRVTVFLPGVLHSLIRLIRADVPQTAGVHLQERIIPKQRGAQRGHSTQESAVAGLLPQSHRWTARGWRW